MNAKQSYLETEWQESLINETLAAMAGMPEVPEAIREKQEELFELAMKEAENNESELC